MSQTSTFEVKCDRCGKTDTQLIGWTGVETVSGESVWQPRRYDFCNECLKQLTAVLKNFCAAL